MFCVFFCVNFFLQLWLPHLLESCLFSYKSYLVLYVSEPFSNYVVLEIQLFLSYYSTSIFSVICECIQLYLSFFSLPFLLPSNKQRYSSTGEIKYSVSLLIVLRYHICLTYLEFISVYTVSDVIKQFMINTSIIVKYLFMILYCHLVLKSLLYNVLG